MGLAKEADSYAEHAGAVNAVALTQQASPEAARAIPSRHFRQSIGTASDPMIRHAAAIELLPDQAREKTAGGASISDSGIHNCCSGKASERPPQSFSSAMRRQILCAMVSRDTLRLRPLR